MTCPARGRVAARRRLTIVVSFPLGPLPDLFQSGLEALVVRAEQPGRGCLGRT